MRVAVLVPGAGFVERGVENTAFYFKRFLSARVKVFGLGDEKWVDKVWGIKRTSILSKFFTKFSNPMNRLKLNKLFEIDEYSLEELTFIVGLLKRLKKYKPDVIINMAGYYTGLFCRLYRFLQATPFIIVGGGGFSKNMLRCKPDVFVAITPSLQNIVEKVEPKINTVLIPNAVSLDEFTPSGKKYEYNDLKKLSLTGDVDIENPIILCTSALEPIKRVHLLIYAVERLGTGTLLLTSDGTLRNKLIEIGKNRLKKRFSYLGVLPRKDLCKLYRTCDVFSLPSLAEPFGIVLLEAMASGKPVVTTDDENRRWIVGEKGGILVDVTDIDAYANALQNAYKTDWLDEPRKQSEKFCWKIIASKYTDLLYDLFERAQKK
jgi:glycosyltransferase involved in cell wall biosynthesis